MDGKHNGMCRECRLTLTVRNEDWRSIGVREWIAASDNGSIRVLEISCRYRKLYYTLGSYIGGMGQQTTLAGSVFPADSLLFVLEGWLESLSDGEMARIDEDGWSVIQALRREYAEALGISARLKG